LRYLEVLLAAEVEEREHRTVQRRLKEAHLPRIKTLEDFNFSQSPKVSAPQLRDLAQGNYIEQAEPVIFLGEAGTGKTHLATALCVAACQEKRRVRFTTAAGLVNELVEAQHNNQLSRVLKKGSSAESVGESWATCGLCHLSLFNKTGKNSRTDLVEVWKTPMGYLQSLAALAYPNFGVAFPTTSKTLFSGSSAESAGGSLPTARPADHGARQRQGFPRYARRLRRP
jgi:hypothetical protein